MSKIAIKSMKLSREFEREVDSIIFKYLGKDVLHADLIRGLSACKLGVTNLLIQDNIRDMDNAHKKQQTTNKN